MTDHIYTVRPGVLGQIAKDFYLKHEFLLKFESTLKVELKVTALTVNIFCPFCLLMLLKCPFATRH